VTPATGAAPVPLAILFDIDGCLISTGGAGTRSRQRAFDILHGIPADIGPFIEAGITDPEVGRSTFTRVLGRPPTDREIAQLMGAYLDALASEVPQSAGYRVMPGVMAQVEHTTAAEYRRVTEVSYPGYVHGTLAAQPRMLPRDQGTVVQVGSALAYRSIPLQNAYCGAQAAVRGFTDSLRSELRHDRSRVRLTHVHLPAVNAPQSGRQRNKMPLESQPVPPLFSPAFLDRDLGKAAWDPQVVNRPNEQQGDIPSETMPGDPGAHGSYRDRERGPDLQLRLRTRLGARTATAPYPASADPDVT
jgi:NAD(P)-dependent dehydrogenase (short-subunit alcohol dehydrogenase family)